MATNAPYYQMRANQSSTSAHNSNAEAHNGVLQDGDYVLESVTAGSERRDIQHLPLYHERATRQAGADCQHSTSEENHNLVELLEAATTAADQSSIPAMPDETEIAAPILQTKTKRRNYSPQINRPTTSRVPSQDRQISTAKRRRLDTSTDPHLQTPDDDITMRSPTSTTSPSPSRDSLLADAPAAGVHSATALFRRTSSLATRKYTRPPMSKLFMSLNITPENFIALQALAKAYMLSPAHPERQSCVGNRGKGDTDMVKLRLFNCVRDFLAGGGVGEQFFGEHVEKPGVRESSEAARALGEKEEGGEKLVWPRDGNKIISLVTPLMRRMVTNERQRLYAIDTRKGGKKMEKESSMNAAAHQNSPSVSIHDNEQHLYPALDPMLQHPPLRMTSPSTPTTTTAHAHPPNTSAPTYNPPILSTPPSILATLPTTDAAEPHLTHINIFLTYTPSGTSKQSIKLDEKRISTTRPAHLTFYNYIAFVEQVLSMINHAYTLHPFLAHQTHPATPSALNNDSNLRGLAKAANALQSASIATPDPDNADSVLDAEARSHSSEPRYTVKIIGPSGWQVIHNAEVWYHVLTERAFATWADGVCNFIVELHDKSAEAVESGAQGEVV